MRSWPGGVGRAAPWSRQRRRRGPRGQRAAPLSQCKQEALRCSIATLLILSTTTEISEILLEGVSCLNFLFPCELRFERSLLARLVFPSCSRLEVGRVPRIIYGCSVHRRALQQSLLGAVGIQEQLSARSQLEAKTVLSRVPLPCLSSWRKGT